MTSETGCYSALWQLSCALEDASTVHIVEETEGGKKSSSVLSIRLYETLTARVLGSKITRMSSEASERVGAVFKFRIIRFSLFLTDHR